MVDKNSFDVIRAVVQLEEKEVLLWVKDQIDLKMAPHEIMDKISIGLEKLGNRFQSGECFIPELIKGGNIFHQAMELVRPMIKGEKTGKKIGTFLIGTVKGDLHDLGKNLVAITFLTAGFEVIDLGKDISTEHFVQEIDRLKPDVVGLSALLSTTTEEQRVVIDALKKAQMRDQVKIIVGGPPVNQKWADKIGADAYGGDAIDGLRKAKHLLRID